MNIEFIRKDEYLMSLQGFDLKPNACQTLGPVRVIIFGHQLGPFPYPADLMEPASHSVCRHRNAVLGLEGRGECGTTPPGAAPAIGTRSRFEYRAQGAREPGHQDAHLDGHRELPIRVDLDAETPGALRAD